MLATETALAQKASLPILTSSRLKDARACKRRHHLKFVDGYRAIREVAALHFGTLVHRGLEAWWISHKNGDAAGALRNALQAMQGEADPFDRARAEVMLYGYDARWGPTMGEYEVLAVEVRFDMPLVNPATGQSSRTWQLAGKIDAVVRHLPTAKVLLVEHKTATGDISQGSEYWRRLRMDGQISIYYEGARALGHDIQGCIYDVLGKPGQKPLKATPVEDRKFTKDGTLYKTQRTADETPEEYRLRIVDAVAEDAARFYQRGEVVRLKEECDEALTDIWETGREVREAEIAGRWPRNPDSCVQYGRTCQFFDACTGQASLDDPGQFTITNDIFPELTGK